MNAEPATGGPPEQLTDEERTPLTAGRRARRLAAIAALAVGCIQACLDLSVLPADATEPNALIYLAFVGAVSLVVGLFTLGVGLIRASRIEQ